MKKFFTLAIIIIVSFFNIYAYADDKVNITKNEAVILSKQKIDALKDFKKYNVQFREYTNSGSIWLINFYNTEEYKNANVFIDAHTKEILKYQILNEDMHNKNNFKISYKEAEKCAKEFLYNINPSSLSHFVEDKSVYNSEASETYNFRYKRIENGIELIFDKIEISIDKTTKEVVFYSYKWTKGDLHDLINNMDVNEPTKLFKETKGLKIVELTKNDKNSYCFCKSYSCFYHFEGEILP
ncbi:MAG: YcdB/YcdC domain-containing protein [Thermoanaerobacteraceae bacterium]